MGKGSANVVRHEAWVGPVITVASMCQHLDGPRHRLAVFDLGRMVLEFGKNADQLVLPLGGLQVGKFGIVLSGYAATDIWSILRNVIWEDEHCFSCCGAMLRFIEPLHHKVLVRCGPTIGDVGGVSMEEARSIINEYWTD